MKHRDVTAGVLFAVGWFGLSVAFWGCASLRGTPGATAPPASPPAPAAPASAAPQTPSPQHPSQGPPPLPETPSKAPAKAPGPETKYFVHVVRYWGESVSIIAGWYTGDIKNWEALAAANPAINPNRIMKGDKIRIPEDIMIKHEPMPKEYVDSFYPKGPGKPKPPAPAQRVEEEPALFGPRK
jgi:hypothetical protein